MSAEKGLALPEGTKVRMTCDTRPFKKGDIVTRVLNEEDDDLSVMFNGDNGWQYLKDHRWELIEEPKKEWLIQDTNGNLTKSDSFRMPKQGDKVQVGEDDGFWYDSLYEFVCLYGDKVLVKEGSEFLVFNQWRFPQEEVTLSDGKTYLVEEIDGEKILKLKN